MPGTLIKPIRQPPWYNRRILEEERPDLAGLDGRIRLEREEAALMDMFIREKSVLQPGDLIITDDNLDEENRRFNRYEVQLKYNEGRYTALYLISRQICANNETVEKNTIFAMKTSLRPHSVNIILRMKRELRILNELKKNKCPFCPMVLDSGRVADLPFIVMTLLDRNVEKLREQIGVFRPSTAYFIAHESLCAIMFLHALKYIHRDFKLTNLCVGAGPMSTRIYLIDYGDTVKKGKKIRYGTPDGYTLPYWSIDAHTRSVAREKGDIESWFYVLLEMLSPGCLPWIKTFDEVEIEKAKIAAWRDYSAFENGNPLLSSLHIRMIFELIRSTRDSFDYGLARKIVREALDSNLNGPLILEWAPNTRIALPPLEGQRITTQAKGMQRVMTPQAKVQRMVMNRLPQQVDRACEGATANRQQRRRLTAEGTMATVVSGEKLMKNNHQQKTPQERTPRNGPTQTKQQVIRKPPIYRK